MFIVYTLHADFYVLFNLLIFIGSRDGHVHFWKCGENFRTLEKLFSVPLVSCFCKVSWVNAPPLILAWLY